jgi:dienelactone hydrolase
MNRKKALGLMLLVLVLAGLLVVPAMADSQFSEDEVVGHSKGNHRLDCYIVRPWDGEPAGPYPLIVWANGWGGNNVAGETTTDWYKWMLQDWAVDGQFIVVAVNAWSAREDDVLNCLQWIADQNDLEGGEYEGVVDLSKIGLAGHSQGAGAVVKAGDGEPNGFEITAVLAFNPYGPSWVSAPDQDGQVLVLAGENDTTTPYTWTYPVFEALINNGVGGWYAVLDDAGHSPLLEYQPVVEEWWDFKLNGSAAAEAAMQALLENPPWTTQYTDGFGTVID